MTPTLHAQTVRTMKMSLECTSEMCVKYNAQLKRYLTRTIPNPHKCNKVKINKELVIMKLA